MVEFEKGGEQVPVHGPASAQANGTPGPAVRARHSP
jgi:hypothetical protein